MSKVQLLGTGLTAWKLAAKRFGPVGGLVIAVVTMAVYLHFRPVIAEKLPWVTGTVE